MNPSSGFVRRHRGAFHSGSGRQLFLGIPPEGPGELFENSRISFNLELKKTGSISAFLDFLISKFAFSSVFGNKSTCPEGGTTNTAGTGENALVVPALAGIGPGRRPKCELLVAPNEVLIVRRCRV